MINRKSVINRINFCQEKEISITNYGVVLAYLTGILEKIDRIFKRKRTINCSLSFVFFGVIFRVPILFQVSPYKYHTFLVRQDCDEIFYILNFYLDYIEHFHAIFIIDLTSHFRSNVRLTPTINASTITCHNFNEVILFFSRVNCLLIILKKVRCNH